MTNSPYQDPRPNIPADIRRAVEVESGHCCAIKDCGEHTYLEIHHIDENRENNVPNNLILLCDKHHKMAHAKVIDRKALREYKKLLTAKYDTAIHERVARLEEILSRQTDLQDAASVPAAAKSDSTVNGLTKESPERADLLNFVLKHVAIRHFEKEVETPFEHQVTFKRGNDVLLLDALRQDDRLEQDFIIEVQYLRKSYTDAPIYAEWLAAKADLYELLTGRKAMGILLIVVGRDHMKGEDELPLTRKGVSECKRKIELEAFTCTEIGFHPGPASLAMFQSYLKYPSKQDRKRGAQIQLPEDMGTLAAMKKLLSEEEYKALTEPEEETSS